MYLNEEEKEILEVMGISEPEKMTDEATELLQNTILFSEDEDTKNAAKELLCKLAGEERRER